MRRPPQPDPGQIFAKSLYSLGNAGAKTDAAAYFRRSPLFRSAIAARVPAAKTSACCWEAGWGGADLGLPDGDKTLLLVARTNRKPIPG